MNVKRDKASVVTNKEFWRAVYLAAVAAGKGSWEAQDAADEAIKRQPK